MIFHAGQYARRSGHPRPCPCGGTNQKEPAIRDKYTLFAPYYDLLSGEYPVYHAGRLLGIDALAPTPGQQVLDVGCGTGLNFPLLQERIGASGTIVGIDRSAEMLGRAPWTAVEERCVDVVRGSAGGGHLQIRAGTTRHYG